MPRRRLPYKEGDWVAVPLDGRGYGVGLIARFYRSLILGYFFAPRRKEVPSALELQVLRPVDAILVAKFGYLGLLHDNWPVIPRNEGWVRDRWPMPAFGRLLAGSNYIAYSSEYNDTFECTSEVSISQTEARKLPQDVVYGDVALQIQLAKMLPLEEAI